MNKSSDNLRKLVVAGVMSAVSIILAITNLGIIPWFSGASLTVMHVPVIIGAILEGPVVGMITGAIFGIYSLIKAAVAPAGPIDPFFTNPMVSVIPRILIGLMTWLAFKAFKGKLDFAAVIVASIAGSLTNTILVLGSLALFGAIDWALVITILVSNGLLEAGAAAVISVAVIMSWKGISGRRQGSDLADLEED